MRHRGGGGKGGGRPHPPRQGHRAPPRPPERSDDDVERIHGFRAGLAVIAKRPADVLRIACTRETVEDVEAALDAVRSDLGVSVLSDQEVERLARSSQHEGLCLEARARSWLGARELGELLVESRGVALALDRVRNSYNIGAILRSAAFFGVDAILLGAPAPHPGLDPNAIRVAEGGVEHVRVSRTTDLADTLARLRQRGVKAYGADGEAKDSAIGFPFERPSILVLGNEREGLGPRVRAELDGLVAIRGSGAVESLNVAVAASVLIAELTRVTAASSGSTGARPR